MYARMKIRYFRAFFQHNSAVCEIGAFNITQLWCVREYQFVAISVLSQVQEKLTLSFLLGFFASIYIHDVTINPKFGFKSAVPCA